MAIKSREMRWTRYKARMGETKKYIRNSERKSSCGSVVLHVTMPLIETVMENLYMIRRMKRRKELPFEVIIKYNNSEHVLSYLRRLDAGFLPRILGFYPRILNAKVMVDDMELGQVFLRASVRFSC
jgi:hypothetical protein